MNNVLSKSNSIFVLCSVPLSTWAKKSHTTILIYPECCMFANHLLSTKEGLNFRFINGFSIIGLDNFCDPIQWLNQGIF